MESRPLMNDDGTFLRSFPVHFEERHARVIQADPGSCLDAVEAFRTEDDLLISACLALRDLPGRMIGAVKGRPAHRFSMASFTPLERHEDRYVLYGLAGAFWRFDYGLHDIGPSSQNFWQANDSICRLILTFEAEALPGGRTRLVTRTIVSCGTISARTQMSRYWTIIRPISGLIRRKILSYLDEIIEESK